MPPALELALFVTLLVLLAATSAAAGALWWRSRSWPQVQAASLARELAERQRALEALLERLERAAAAPRPRRTLPVGPKVAPLRVDPPQGSAVTGPTLIAVPDLAAPTTAPAAAELARRFGPVWELADAGAPAEAIARQTGLPSGQVELILGLRRRAAAAEGRP